MKHIEQWRPILGAALIEAMQADCGHAAASIIADGLSKAFAEGKNVRAAAEIAAVELLPFVRPDLFKQED